MFLCLIGGSLMAQTADLKWGLPFKKTLIRKGFTLVSLNDGGMVLLTPVYNPLMQATSVSFMKFNSQLGYVSSTTFPLKDGSNTLTYSFTVRIKGKTLIFSTLTEKGTAQLTYYYHDFNTEDGTLSSKATKVMSVSVDKGPFPTFGNLYWVRSADSTKLALIHQPSEKRSSLEKFRCMVIDNNLNVVSDVTQTSALRDKDFRLEQVAVSNDGVVYLSGIVVIGPPKPFIKESNYNYSILRIDPQDNEPREAKVDLGKLYITDMQIGCDEDNRLVAAGFYSEKGKGIKGAFCYVLDARDGSEVNFNHMDFPISLITEGMTDKQAEKTENKAAKGGNTEMLNYVLDELIFREDGGVYLVAEYFDIVTTTTTNSNGTTSTRTTYYYKNIIVVGIDQDGKIDVARKILKAQKGSSTTFLGYVMSERNGQLYFVFADNALNNAPNPQKTHYCYFGKSGVVTMVELNAAGEINRRNLYSYEKNKAWIVPYASQDLPDGRMLVMTMAGSKMKALIINPQ